MFTLPSHGFDTIRKECSKHGTFELVFLNLSLKV